MESLQEAKKNLLINVATNVLSVLLIALIGIWLTAYLIRILGVAVYGIVPLIISIVAYFDLFTVIITSTLGRFVSLNLDRREYEKSNVYFNSAFFSILTLCIIAFIPAVLIAIFLPFMFKIPQNYEVSSSWLFFLISLCAFFTALTSPFLVSTFVTHRFYLENMARMMSRLLQIAIIAGAFTFLSASLLYVGLGYLTMAIFMFLCAVILAGRLTPQLHIRWKDVHWKASLEMGQMGGWMLIDQIGALLYYNTALMLINIFLGLEQGGRYAPLLQWVFLLRLLVPAIGGVFAPVAIDLIARGDLKTLAFQTKRAIRIVGLLMAFPAGLLCGLSAPLLERWLGSEFKDLSPLMWILISPQVIILSLSSLYGVNRGMNKVTIPALVTLAGGVLNVVLAIIFLRYTKLGLYGMALATTMALFLRSIFFTPVYTAVILGQKPTAFLTSIVPGTIMVMALSVSGWLSSKFFNLVSYPHLLITSVIISVFYIPVCFAFMLNSGERTFLWSLISRKKALVS
jgi:O-antigen/teichoic acid export membrane protein